MGDGYVEWVTFGSVAADVRRFWAPLAFGHESSSYMLISFWVLEYTHHSGDLRRNLGLSY